MKCGSVPSYLLYEGLVVLCSACLWMALPKRCGLGLANLFLLLLLKMLLLQLLQLEEGFECSWTACHPACRQRRRANATNVVLPRSQPSLTGLLLL